MAEIIEKGPWKAVQKSKAPSVGYYGTWIESGDFEHDVRLYVSGNFKEAEQRMAYAEEIAKRLNAWSVFAPPNQEPK